MKSNGTPALIPEQIRAARAMLRITAQQLADRASVGVATVRRAETSDKITYLNRSTDQAIRRALEEAGVIFLDANGHAGGVALKRS